MKRKILVIWIILAVSLVYFNFEVDRNDRIGEIKVYSTNPVIFFPNMLEKISSPARNINIKNIDNNLIIEPACNGKPSIGVMTKEWTNSMDPTLDGGNKILSCQINKSSDIIIGDIVIFTRNGTDKIAHRIIDMNNDSSYYLIKGDNTEMVENISLSNITHYVIGVIF